MRINKLLSSLGYCSRREANRWIEAGRLTVNGNPCKTGQWLETVTTQEAGMSKTHLLDQVLLDGHPLIQQPKVYLLLNKPVGITCTAEPEVADNIIAFLNYPAYVFPVGRLDKDSQGLMLLTNDGDLAHDLLYSENEHDKTYHVTVDRILNDGFLTTMASGVLVDGIMTRPCQVRQLTEDTFEMVMSQGMNRQIRKMCRGLGYQVCRLERVKIMDLELGTLAEGQWRTVSEGELQGLKAALGRKYKRL